MTLAAMYRVIVYAIALFIIAFFALWLPGFLQDTLYKAAPDFDTQVTGALAKAISAGALLPLYAAARRRGAGVFPPYPSLGAWVFALPVVCVIANLAGFTFDSLSDVPMPSSFLFALSTGIYEEILFRGALFWGLARLLRPKPYGAVIALIVSSLLFSLPHAVNPTPSLAQLSYAIWTGIIFGTVVIKTKSLILPIACHAANNFLVTAVTVMQPEIVYQAIAVFSPLVLGAIAVYVLLRDAQRNQRAHSTPMTSGAS